MEIQYMIEWLWQGCAFKPKFVEHMISHSTLKDKFFTELHFFSILDFFF